MHKRQICSLLIGADAHGHMRQPRQAPPLASSPAPRSEECRPAPNRSLLISADAGSLSRSGSVSQVRGGNGQLPDIQTSEASLELQLPEEFSEPFDASLSFFSSGTVTVE